MTMTIFLPFSICLLFFLPRELAHFPSIFYFSLMTMTMMMILMMMMMIGSRKPQTGGMELPSGVYIHIYIHTYIHARPVEGHPGLYTHIPGRMQDIRVYIHTCIQVAYPADWRHPGHRSRSRSQSRSKSRATHQVQERSAAGRGGSLINSSGAGEVGGWERR